MGLEQGPGLTMNRSRSGAILDGKAFPGCTP